MHFQVFKETISHFNYLYGFIYIYIYIYIYRMAQKERMSLGPHAYQIYLPAISFFGVTSNQKSTFENPVQSTK